MVIVDKCLVSDEILSEFFACNIEACKGACCVEGDAGAPLEEGETALIRKNLDAIKKYMDAEGLKSLEKLGISEKDPFDMDVTTCKPNNECTFAIKKDGILNCAIEWAHREEKTDFLKPISCHLYPIRVQQFNDYEALNYHQWSICAAACEKGNNNKIRVMDFAKTALIRKYGAEWFQKLVWAAQEK